MNTGKARWSNLCDRAEPVSKNALMGCTERQLIVICVENFWPMEYWFQSRKCSFHQNVRI